MLFDCRLCQNNVIRRELPVTSQCEKTVMITSLFKARSHVDLFCSNSVGRPVFITRIKQNTDNIKQKVCISSFVRVQYADSTHLFISCQNHYYIVCKNK